MRAFNAPFLCSYAHSNEQDIQRVSSSEHVPPTVLKSGCVPAAFHPLHISISNE